MSFADAYGGAGTVSSGPSGSGVAGPGGGFHAMDALARESKKVSSLIFQMTTDVSSFKRSVDALGTGKDTRELRAKLNAQRESIGGMAKEASSAVKRLARDGRDDSKSQKTVRDFHGVLKEFQKAQRICAERESAFLPQKNTAQRQSYGANDEEMRRESSGYSDSEQQSLLFASRGNVSRRQDLVRDEGEMEFNNALIEEREHGILEIQQQIGEVNEIFQDLAVLVNEQGQMIDDIEANIVSTAVRTKDAQRELTKADKSQKAARNKMICVAAGVAAVLVIFILFLLN
jgi:syntaxin 7